MGETQRTQGAFAGRDDQFIGILRLDSGDRRSDVLNEGNAIHRLGPAGVAHQIAGHQLQIGQAQRGAHFASAGQIADGAAHCPAVGHQRLDDETGDVTRCAGHQHLARCHITLPLLSGWHGGGQVPAWQARR